MLQIIITNERNTERHFIMWTLPKFFKTEQISSHKITTRKFKHDYHSNSESKLEPSIIWEDNQGFIHLANDPLQNRPRTKHISIKWHLFRDEIQKETLKLQKYTHHYTYLTY
jgi:hypothetical protein